MNVKMQVIRHRTQIDATSYGRVEVLCENAVIILVEETVEFTFLSKVYSYGVRLLKLWVSTFFKIMRGIRTFRTHKVNWNEWLIDQLLCTISVRNGIYVTARKFKMLYI